MVDSPSSSSDGRHNQLALRWVLIGIFILAIGMVWAIADADQATAYGLRTIGTSSPISPQPTPIPINITGIDPARGLTGTVVQVNIYGENFREDGQVYIRYSSDQNPRHVATEQPWILVTSRFVSSSHIVAKIPAQLNNLPLKAGFYDLRIQFGERKVERNQAYRAIDPTSVNDLYSEPYHLSSTPSDLRVGEETEFTLKVFRMGGQGGTGLVHVDFYVGSINDANLIGRGTFTGISPNGDASSSFVKWTPTARGDVKIIAVIDASNNVVESDETNNVVETTRHVSMRLTADTYPPVVSNLTVNGGVNEVHEQDISLHAVIEDLPDPAHPNALVSGPSNVYYVELHWYNGVGGTGSWIPVNWTEWLWYSGEPDDFTLHPTPGLRYLQAWGADGAGNISNYPSGRSLNYIPNQDEVAQSEIRVYRREVAAGQCLSVEIVPQAANMDPDLYIWPPTGPVVYSFNGAGETDRVIIQPTQAGSYQIEVEGFTDAVYTIQIDVTASCNQGRADEPAETSAKSPRSVPAIPVDEAPSLTESPVPQEEIFQYLMFLSVTSASRRVESTQSIYLPVLTR